MYEVLALIGEGGMGQVYRATDTRLKRQVALKILPRTLAADTDRLARFAREAELLASLNHPHIAAIYGMEDGEGVTALVMELVEGDDLSQRIARGALPPDDALRMAVQVTEALEAAHARGVIHRDLKPANIKVRADGTVKVLDFGLAKATEPTGAASGGAGRASLSPTMLSPAELTGIGAILGTAAYMSPEQARGKPVDQRGDIWAFGCVLYEMLAGCRPFDTGETVSDAVAAVLTREPDWTALRADVPPPVRALLRRCLQKDPARRLHHISDARVELEDALAGRAETPAPLVHAAPASVTWRGMIPWTLAAVACGVAAWALWMPAAPGSRAPDAQPVRRLELTLPPGVELFTASSRTVAISPDGSRLAFVGTVGGARQVYIRPLDRFEATPLRGSDGATACFFSPDGQSIGLVTSSGVLKTVSLADGLVTTFTGEASFLYGSAWTADNQIIFVRGGTLWEVPRAGGTARSLTTLGGEQGDTLHAWPVMLPGGETMLFGAAAGDQWRIDALALATGERRTVVEQGTLPLYATSGHLVFVRDGQVLVAPFDTVRVQLTGPAVQAVDGLPTGVLSVPVVDVSSSGTLVYAQTSAVSRLVWMSRDGAEQPLNDTLRSYASPRLSPDGTRLVVQAGDLWLQDLTRATFTRLAAVTNAFPMWTPDGRRILYRTPNGLTLQDVGGGDREVIRGTSEFDYPGSLTPDGETLAFLRSSQQTSFDVYVGPVRDLGSAKPLLDTNAYEGGARVSPDGRWLAYVSNETGQNQVYLRAFSGPERRWQVSTEGGTQAVWNPNGREIFYRNGDRMMAVEIAGTSDLTLSPPRLLFEQRYAFGAGITIANYDVSRDGRRFVMVKDEPGAGRLNIVLNWFSDLARLAPAAAP